MKVYSAKAKGRRCAKECKELLLSLSQNGSSRLFEDDIIVTSSGETGPDLKLSPAAKRMYPFAIECKNQEKLNIWQALEQASNHRTSTSEVPLLVFKRNRSDMYVALDFKKFLELIR